MHGVRVTSADYLLLALRSRLAVEKKISVSLLDKRCAGWLRPRRDSCLVHRGRVLLGLKKAQCSGVAASGPSQRQSIQEGGSSASDAPHISKRKRRDRTAASLLVAFGHVPRKRGLRHGLSNEVEDTSGAHSWVSFEVSAGNIQVIGTCMHCLKSFTCRCVRRSQM